VSSLPRSALEAAVSGIAPPTRVRSRRARPGGTPWANARTGVVGGLSANRSLSLVPEAAVGALWSLDVYMRTSETRSRHAAGRNLLVAAAGRTGAGSCRASSRDVRSAGVGGRRSTRALVARGSESLERDREGLDCLPLSEGRRKTSPPDGGEAPRAAPGRSPGLRRLVYQHPQRRRWVEALSNRRRDVNPGSSRGRRSGGPDGLAKDA
jgi:hypothetical protein